MNFPSAQAAAPLPQGSRRLRDAAALFAVWTVIGLLFASQFYLSSSLYGRPVAWSDALAYALSDWYVWAGLSLITLYLSRRFPIERMAWSDNVVIHLIASLLTALLYTLLRAFVGQIQSHLIGDPIPYGEALRPLFLKSFHFNFIIYWVILAIAHAVSYYRKFHERERRALELERLLAEARLQALQMQLNPHFLFNAMHSISALMRKDVDAADSMLARLSELLRLTLRNDATQRIPLSKELEILDRYLDIERIRFRERLSVRFEIDDGAREALVPCLILQPLVENALKHGIAPRAKPGEIRICARLENGFLVLSVADNGAGLDHPRQDGIGLSNTQARLAELYPGASRFAFDALPEGGVRVTLAFPSN